MVDDGKLETTFYIMDMDGEDKTLVVDETYRAAARDSWLVAWEEQQSGKPRDAAVV